MGKIWRVYHEDELKYLQDHGFRYELLARDIRSNAKIYLFINSDKLQENINRFKKETLVS